MVKKFFTLSILLIVFTSTAFTQQTKITTDLQQVKQLFKSTPIIPDVMGKVNYIPPNGVSSPASVDSFPLFNGFPVQVSGSSLEGGIFCNLDADPELEFVYCITYQVVALNMDGSPVAGWPKTLSQPTQSAPAFGDIDGDGQGEIVVNTFLGTTSGTIYAWHKDGSTVTGFPVTHGYLTRTPVLADLNNDGALEIIVNKRLYPLGEEWVYKGDGTVLWSAPLDHVPASSAAVGDITGDGVPEVVCESYVSIYAFDNAGNLLTGFPFNLPADVTTSYSSPVLVDVDGDNNREIIFGTHTGSGTGFVYILKNDGTVYPGWPKATSYWVYTPPAVGYVDGDNTLDVVVGDQVLSGTPVDKIYAWDINGNPLAGFPIGPVNAVNSQIILADLDNNGSTDLITDDNGAPYYHGYNSDGTILTGWPLMVTGETTFYEMPALADINNDGSLDLLGVGNEGFSNPIAYIHLWDTGYPFVADNYTLPVFQYNERHNGVYGDIASAIPVELLSFTSNISGNDVILNWSTATETNNRGFDVERSTDNINFVKVGFVRGNGTTTQKSVYIFTDKEVNSGNYYYRLKQIDFNGSYTYSKVINADVNNLSYRLAQNYPNPFNPTTSINFSIPVKSLINLEIFNALGQKVKTLVNEEKEAGNYSVNFNADNLSSGMYLYKLSTGKFTETRKMLLLK